MTVKRLGAHLEASTSKRIKHDSEISPGGSAESDETHSESSQDSGDDPEDENTDDELSVPLGPLRTAEDDDEYEEGEAKSAPLPNRISLPSRAPLPTSRKLPSGNQPYQNTPPQTADFASLGITPSLVTALTSMSIKRPTPVQAACIPPLLAGRDCIGNAKTGQGKTVAFAIPILQKLSQDPFGIFALILTPTRELAFQISEQFVVLGASLNIRTSVIVGGMDMIAQALELNNRPHVVIATPGRLVDHINSGGGGGASEWGLSRIKFLILDEADRLLSSTFAPDLATIFSRIPNDRQTCLFTATLTPSIEKLAIAPPRPGKQKPFIHRDATSIETVDSLKQQYILCPSHAREVYLYHLLCNPPESITHLRRAAPPTTKETRKQQKLQDQKSRNALKSKSKSNSKSKPKPKRGTNESDEPPLQPPPTIIFVAHARTAAYLTHLLQTLELRCTALHSRLTQPQRIASLNLFRACVVPILICTDVGARGLDMDGVGMVVNWDLPSSRKVQEGDVEGVAESGEGGAEETYVHRVGRTARMGKGGFAVSFVTERHGDEDTIKRIENRINVQLTELELPEQKVLEKLNVVSTAKRVANMELHDSDFGKREEIHKAKKAQRQAKS